MSETYTVGGDTWQPLAGFDISGQTFTPLESHTINYIDLDVWLWSYVPPEIALTECDASHTPIGSILTYGHALQPLIYLPPSQRRVRFRLDTPISVTQGTIYSIWIYKPLEPAGPINQVLYDKDDATYPRGHIIFSNDGGNTWTHFYNSDFIFAEFGNPPLPKPDPPPPIDNFSTLDIGYLPLTDGITIYLSTSVPCHLTCYWTDKQPLKHHTSRIVRGLEVPWATYFCFVAWHPVEQNEPGDTLYHSFDIAPWPICETRWFSFRGEVDDLQSPSVGPIFEKHRTLPTFPRTILRPSAPGDVCLLPGEVGAACPDHYLNVDNVIFDGFDSYVHSHPLDYTWNFWDLYHIQPHGFILAPPITNVRVYTYCRIYYCPVGNPHSGIRIGLKTHGWDQWSPTMWAWPGWTLQYFDWPLNPVTFQPWTLQDITDLQLGIALHTPHVIPDGGHMICCTQIWAVISF